MMTPRADLVAAIKPPQGYIADIVLPPLFVGQKSGTIYYQSAITTRTADTARAAAAAVTLNARTLPSTTWTVAEAIDREGLDENELGNYGGDLAAYERDLALTGVKALRDAVESRVVTIMALTTSPTDVSTDPVTGIRNASAALRGYGQVALFGSALAFNVLRDNADVRDAMKATGVAPVGLDPRAISGAQLAATLHVDQVTEAFGPAASAWPADHLGLVITPTPGLMPRSEPQFGRNLVYAWKAGAETQTILAEEGYDITRRATVLDFVTYTVGKVFNSTWLTKLKIA